VGLGVLASVCFATSAPLPLQAQSLAEQRTAAHEVDVEVVTSAPPQSAVFEEDPAPSGRDRVIDNPLAHNTWYGSTGGLRVVDAGSGPVGTLRFQLGIDHFRSRGFLLEDDVHKQLGGTLSVSGTPLPFLELFGSFNARSNRNSAGNPVLLQAIGDIQFGGKLYRELTPWLSIGGDLRVLLKNLLGDLGLNAGATSFGLRAALTADFTALEHAWPLLLRVNLGYVLNNSGKLVERVENQRYAALPEDSRAPKQEETRNLISRIERFGLGVDRVDTLELALGAELPLRLFSTFYVRPLVEWQLGIPVNRQGFDCPAGSSSGRVNRPDGCLSDVGFGAWPSSLSLGARVLPAVDGLALLAALELGVSGAHRFVHELAPTRPWAVLFALSYAFSTQPQTQVRYVKVPQPQTDVDAVDSAARVRALRIRGQVVDGSTGQPIIGAVVHYPSQELSSQLTGAEGRYISYAFPPGTVPLEITHPDYDPARCVVEIPSELSAVEPAQGERFATSRCELTPLPAPPPPVHSGSGTAPYKRR